MKFSGWKLLDKIIIVSREHTYYKDGTYEEVSQGFLVDPSSDNQLKTALKWANTKKCINPDASYKDREYIDIKGVVYEFDNKGWKIKLYDSAKGSYQGGKLGFWNCEVSKDDHKFIIGIKADLLLDLLVSATIINGEIQEDVFFARQYGGLGMLHEGMGQYQEALKDMQRREQTKKKTSKYRLGYNYHTLTENYAYIGDLYCWAERKTEEVYNHSTWPRNITIGKYKILDRPKKIKVIVPFYGDFKSSKEFIDQQIRKIEEALEKKSSLFGIFDYHNTIHTPTPRAEGEYCVECNATNEDWDKLIDMINKSNIKRSQDVEVNNKKHPAWDYCYVEVNMLLTTPTPDKKPEISEDLKQKIYEWSGKLYRVE